MDELSLELKLWCELASGQALNCERAEPGHITGRIQMIPPLAQLWQQNARSISQERFEALFDPSLNAANISLCANLAFWHSALQEAHLCIYARAVYTDLVMRDNGKDGGHAFAGVRKIAKTCGISTKLVVRSIKELEAAGLIEVKRALRKRSHYRVRSLEEWQQWKAKSVLPRDTDSANVDTKLYPHGTQPVSPRDTDLYPHGKRKEIPRDPTKEICSADALAHPSFSLADSGKPKRQKSSSLPPLSELIDYCAKRRLPESDAKYLHDHWLGSGFTIGKKAIRDWRAVVRSWQANGYLPSQKQNPQAPQARSCL